MRWYTAASPAGTPSHALCEIVVSRPGYPTTRGLRRLRRYGASGALWRGWGYVASGTAGADERHPTRYAPAAAAGRQQRTFAGPSPTSVVTVTSAVQLRPPSYEVRATKRVPSAAAAARGWAIAAPGRSGPSPPSDVPKFSYVSVITP